MSLDDDHDIASPQLLRLIDYWETRRGPRRWPARRDIDPLDFPYVLGNVALIDVLDAPQRFRVRLFGDNLVRRIGMEITGKMLEAVPLPGFGDQFVRCCSEIVERGAPFRAKAEYVTDDRLSQQEVVALPLSDDGQTINMLLFAFWFIDQGMRGRRLP
jgi:hypothetical protein